MPERCFVPRGLNVLRPNMFSRGRHFVLKIRPGTESVRSREAQRGGRCCLHEEAGKYEAQLRKVEHDSSRMVGWWAPGEEDGSHRAF